MKFGDPVRAALIKSGRRIARQLFAERTIDAMILDLKRTIARSKNLRRRALTPPSPRLHFGCGWRRVSGWLNVDVRHSDHDMDLAAGRLPWRDNVFEAAVGQHVVEHLELVSEFLPLARELHRVLQPGGELWISCPDLEKVCRFYVEEKLELLLADRQERYPDFELGAIPLSHLVNDLFHAGGEHRNLYDFLLLQWSLQQAGFVDVSRANEAALLSRFPDFPPRRDDFQTLLVRAKKSVAPR